MYFSLITPAEGRERDAAHEWARGGYEEHQWLWRFLPAPAGSARDFLFRRRDGESGLRCYVVSKREPVAPSAAEQCSPEPTRPDRWKANAWPSSCAPSASACCRRLGRSLSNCVPAGIG